MLGVSLRFSWCVFHFVCGKKKTNSYVIVNIKKEHTLDWIISRSECSRKQKEKDVVANEATKQKRKLRPLRRLLSLASKKN